MQTYRTRLRMRSATLTPWQADTLFGHWCWLILYEEGESALSAFLDPFRAGDPPLVLSNGFPMDDEVARLPRPILPQRRADGGSKREMIQEMERVKAVKAIRFVTLEEFNALCRGDEVPLGERKEPLQTRPMLKNQINRLSGTTTPIEEGEGGNLYDVEEIAFVDSSDVYPRALDVAFYVKARDGDWGDRAEQLFSYLAQSGYGAKKSVGYGQVRVVSWKPFHGFERPVGANGFVSLSHWVPARGDPRMGFYDTLVKYGKLGEELAVGENPFKFPLTMLTSGSSFYAEGSIREVYGRLVTQIAPAAPQVVQYGFAFAVPACLPLPS